MNTAVITIKVRPEIKRKAQKLAQDLGFNLSSLIKGLLNQIIKTRTVTFSVNDEIPSDHMIQALKESAEDIKAGRVSPTFTETNDAIKWLNSDDKKYENKIRRKFQKTIR